jgi:hypothetical protein
MTERKRKILYAALFILLTPAIFAGTAILLINLISCSNMEEEWKALIKEDILIDNTESDDFIYAIVSRDGVREYGDSFLVLRRMQDGSWSIEYENDFSGLKPWKIDRADIDDDGEEEILIAVRKTTMFDKEEKNRMFIFNYTDGVLVKKWTGSQIAGTWRDFYTGQLFSAPGCEIIFIEQTEDNSERIKVYNWFDFGFFMTAESGRYSSVDNLSVTGENSLQATIKDERGERTAVLYPGNGILREADEGK